MLKAIKMLNQKQTDKLHWDAVMQLAIVGLVLFVLVKNEPNVANMATSSITALQGTLTSFLTATF